MQQKLEKHTPADHDSLQLKAGNTILKNYETKTHYIAAPLNIHGLMIETRYTNFEFETTTIKFIIESMRADLTYHALIKISLIHMPQTIQALENMVQPIDNKEIHLTTIPQYPSPAQLYLQNHHSFQIPSYPPPHSSAQVHKIPRPLHHKILTSKIPELDVNKTIQILSAEMRTTNLVLITKNH